jgi:hypothetical protein
MPMTDKHLADSHLRAGSHLDAAIDRAVREMMRVEPRADLRERVMAELVEEPARATWWPRLAFGSAALAAAVLIVLMLVNRPVDRPVDRTIAQTQPPPSAPARTGETTGPATGTEPTIIAGGRTVVAGRKPRTVPRTPVIEDRLVQAASIDTTELVAIEPMAPVERLKPIEPIAFVPIAIAPIEIRPLTPPR